jgi:hypothetical protein
MSSCSTNQSDFQRTRYITMRRPSGHRSAGLHDPSQGRHGRQPLPTPLGCAILGCVQRDGARGISGGFGRSPRYVESRRCCLVEVNGQSVCQHWQWLHNLECCVRLWLHHNRFHNTIPITRHAAICFKKTLPGHGPRIQTETGQLFAKRWQSAGRAGKNQPMEALE